MEDLNRLPQELELLLTVHFSGNIPDLILDIPNPTTTTVAALKRLIRDTLPPELSSRHLHLRYSGRSLNDPTSLSAQLRLWPDYYQRAGRASGNRASSSGTVSEPKPRESSPSQASTTLSTSAEDPPDSSGKGAEPVSDQRPRISIQCSIGPTDLTIAEGNGEGRVNDALTPALEGLDTSISAGLGRPGPSAPSRLSSDMDNAVSVSNETNAGAGDSSHATPMLERHGFDRLLTSGFTPDEVSSLRSQFITLLSFSHTPDTLPSGSELRRLEDRWMDEGASDGDLGNLEASGENTNIFGDANVDTNDTGFLGQGSASHALDDMLWGTIMGFFWPVGCALWLLREEGIWSWRKGLAVFVGVLVNLGFGTARILS